MGDRYERSRGRVSCLLGKKVNEGAKSIRLMIRCPSMPQSCLSMRRRMKHKSPMRENGGFGRAFGPCAAARLARSLVVASCCRAVVLLVLVVRSGCMLVGPKAQRLSLLLLRPTSKLSGPFYLPVISRGNACYSTSPRKRRPLREGRSSQPSVSQCTKGATPAVGPTAVTPMSTTCTDDHHPTEAAAGRTIPMPSRRAADGVGVACRPPK